MKIHLAKWSVPQSIESENSLGKSVFLVVGIVKIQLGKVCIYSLGSVDLLGKGVYLVVRK